VSTLVLTVEAGARQRIGAIKFAGSSPLEPDEIRRALLAIGVRDE